MGAKRDGTPSLMHCFTVTMIFASKIHSLLFKPFDCCKSFKASTTFVISTVAAIICRHNDDHIYVPYMCGASLEGVPHILTAVYLLPG